MLFDTIQNKYKTYSFTSLLKTRMISALATLIIHGTILVLALFVVPIVQVNVFEEEVLDVVIVPFDPLIFPDREGIYEVPDELESTLLEDEIPYDAADRSREMEGSLEAIDGRKENPVLPVQEESSRSPTLISGFRLDKKAGTQDESDPEKNDLLILAPPDSRKILPKKDDTIPGKVVDFDKYLEPEFPRKGSITNRGHRGQGSSSAQGQLTQAYIKGTQIDMSPWASVVVERIQNNWIIPSDRENPAKGRVGIDVKISKKGDMVEIELIESSLIQSFDLAALAAIKDSAPFPSLPSSYPGIVLEIYFVFQYND